MKKYKRPSKIKQYRKQLAAIKDQIRLARAKLSDCESALDIKVRQAKDADDTICLLKSRKEWVEWVVNSRDRWQMDFKSDVRVSIHQFIGIKPKSKFASKTTEIKDKLDREILRLAHGGRICELIIFGSGDGFEKLFSAHAENRSKPNYAGIPMYISDAVKPFCFIIKSTHGQSRVMGQSGWQPVATMGYNAA